VKSIEQEIREHGYAVPVPWKPERLRELARALRKRCKWRLAARLDTIASMLDSWNPWAGWHFTADAKILLTVYNPTTPPSSLDVPGLLDIVRKPPVNAEALL
jgi:hypothetical protein